MKILAIGNSFSMDATRYLYGIARADGVKLKVVNLYIGGCSLYRHYRNMLSGENAYLMELNGMSSGFYVSLKEALLSDEWDVVTLQQSSPASPHKETYEPYLSRLAAFVREHAPAAKLYIQQTWAYEAGCPRLINVARVESAEEMLKRLTENYRFAAETVSADGIIPAGDAMYRYTKAGENGELLPIHRDTFHASYGVGRYLLGLVWYMTLCGGDISENTFRDFDVPVTDEEIARAKRVAADAVRSFGEALF
jgi:hypothetical protein